MKHAGQDKVGKKLARVASLSRGRMRVQVAPASRRDGLLERIKSHLEKQSGIDDVVIHPATGSAVIAFDHTSQHSDGILGFLRDIDVIVESIQSSAGGDAFPGGAGLAAAVDDINAYFQRALGVAVDLRMAAPLGLLAIGLWSIARHGPRLESVPGWVFLWLAFDTFVKLNLNPSAVLQQAMQAEANKGQAQPPPAPQP